MPRTSKRNRDAIPPDDPVTAYAEAVRDGRVLAGRAVRLAAARHCRDVEEGPARGLEWCPDLARHALEFFPKFLRLAEGEHAGQPFALQPWQQFIIGSLFGWLGPDHLRRFRTAYLEIGKGNGKTPMAAGIGLYGLTMDDEPGAQIFCAAVTRDQARIAFTDAKRMAEAAPALAGRLDIGEHNIAHLASGSFMRPVSSEGRALEGKRVHMALIDEIHQHPDAIVVTRMREGTKGRRQALIIEITNSGYDRESICWQHHDYSLKVLDGALTDDAWFAYVCQLDACHACLEAGHAAPQSNCATCDHWTDERVWPKANPNLGISITSKYLRELVREASGMPAQQNEVRRLNFCEWTESVNRWFMAEEWEACARAVDPVALQGRRCIVGLDLATTHDLAAAVLVFPDDEFFILRQESITAPDLSDEAPPPPIREVHGGVDVLVFTWCPEAGVRVRSQRDKAPYQLWLDQGHLEATPGNVIDHRRIRQVIQDFRDVHGYDIAEIAYDPAFAAQLALQLQDEDGFTVVPIPQTFQLLNEPCLLLEMLVRGRRLRHGGNPPLRWAMANVSLDIDGGGRKRPSKARSTDHIDPISALVTALRRLSTLQAGAGPRISRL